jgi:hypothetical protein
LIRQVLIRQALLQQVLLKPILGAFFVFSRLAIGIGSFRSLTREARSQPIWAGTILFA